MEMKPTKQCALNYAFDFVSKLKGELLGECRFVSTEKGDIKLYIKKNNGSERSWREHCVFFGDEIMANIEYISDRAPGYFGDLDVDDLCGIMRNHRLIGGLECLLTS